MAKLTTRDYKSTQRRAPDLRRLREFGYGMLAGIVLASTAFVYLGGTPRKSRDTADAPRPDPYRAAPADADRRSEEHTSELQSQSNLVCRLLLEKKKNR